MTVVCERELDILMGKQNVIGDTSPSIPTPSSDRPLKVAVVGCGHWGPNHVRCFQRMHKCSVIAVDKAVSRLERLAVEYPHIKYCTDYDSILSDESVDAVVVATPTASHFGLVRKALQAGEHVLCEKPLCLFSSEAKDLIDQGELGKVLYLSAERTNLGPIRDDVNAAYDLAAHDIAVFNGLLDDEPVEVSATGGMFVRQGIQDVVFISLRYLRGPIGHIHASWLNPHKVRRLASMWVLIMRLELPAALTRCN